MNRNRFKSDMEAAWELRPMTDGTPETHAHINRFAAKASKKPEEKKSEDEKKCTCSVPPPSLR